MIKKKSKLIFIFLILFISISISLPFGYILYQGRYAAPEQSDVMIVLGCQLWGYDPSPSLRHRLDKAVEVYNMGLVKHIIVSGAQGSDEPAAEAQIMKKYLIGKGVTPDIILVEEQSFNTYQNLKYSKVLMDQKGFKSAVIVTNDFHIGRSLMIARRLGIKASGSPAPTPSSPGLKQRLTIREIPALVKDWVLIR